MDEGKLFSEVRFNVAQCNNQQTIKNILIEGGAKHINYLSDDVTLVIADDNCPEAEEAVELFDKPVVSSLWIYLSLKANKLLPTEAFSPMKRIFRNVIASFSADLNKDDVDILVATLTFYGGRVSKDVTCSTHFITPNADASDLPDKFSSQNKQLKIVAPDWILESARLKCCCEEHLYDPNLLLSSPAPIPIPTPPLQPVELSPPIQRDNTQLVSTVTESGTLIREAANEISNHQAPKNDNPSQSTAQPQSYPSQPVHQLQTLPPSQPPRPRASSNLIRGAQPKFRPLLNPNHSNVPIAGLAPQNRMLGSEAQQPKKVTINYGQYRKMAPYQNNTDHQSQAAQMQQQPSYPQPTQHISVQQPTGAMTTSRLPQPNMYHQIRGPYQSNHMGPRAVAQTSMLNQQQPQQTTQMINRFQDPNAHLNQRPYQVCVQPQPVNSNYQQNNMHRPSIYYTQSNQVRIPQQGPPMRIMHSEQVTYDGFNSTNHPHEPLSTGQQTHYQTHTRQPQHPQPPKPLAQQQSQQQQVYPHTSHQSQQPQQPTIIQNRPQFQVNYSATTIGANQVRTARNLFKNQQETKGISVRPTGPQQVAANQGKAPRMPNSSLPQPHPSIFEHIQESNLAQIKAKVPIIENNIDYFGYDPKDDVPSDLPFIGCRFKMVDYEDVNPRSKEKWFDAIRAAGGSFNENLEDLTHLICENRLSDLYSAAKKLSVRCVTIYWISDVLGQDRLSYPWKALHLPVPFSPRNKPLTNQIISVTNFKGKERLEVKEMIVKTGAKFTDYFSPSNTLLICGHVNGEKWNRALEWRIPLANCQIISDILLDSSKDFNLMLSQSKYQLFNRENPLKLSSYSDVRDLMSPWKKAISVTPLKRADKANPMNGTCEASRATPTSNEDSGLATGGSNNSDFDATNGKSNPINPSIGDTFRADTHGENKNSDPLSENQKEFNVHIGEHLEKSRDIRNNHSELNDNSEVRKSDESGLDKLAVSSTPPKASDGQDNIDNKINKSDTVEVVTKESSEFLDQNKRSLRKSSDPVRLLFTHLESRLSDQLKSYATNLNLGFASSPTNCTHLIVDRISRTSKFICAFSHASYILSYKWIVESHEAKNLLDEKHFILQDKEGEETFSFNLVYSLLKRRRRSGLLFKDFVFFVTPSVQLNVSHLKEMIESAGGVMETRKPPTKLQNDQMKLEGKKFVMVSCDQDLHLCSSLELQGIEIVNVEFVISGILRQDIDFQAHRIKTTRALFIRPETNSLAQISQPSPPKKLRLDDSNC